MRMVASIAGATAAGMVHHGLLNGDTTQPRPSHVGLNSSGTISFGVRTPAQASNTAMEQIVMKTPKSLMTTLTWFAVGY